MRLTLRELSSLFKANNIEYVIKTENNGVAQINILYKVETAK